MNGNIELCTDNINDYDIDVARVLDGLQLLQEGRRSNNKLKVGYLGFYPN